MKTVETFKRMRNIDSADCFFETVKQKAANHNFISEPILPRKRRFPNYKSLNDFFVVEGQSSEALPYFPSSSKKHYRAIFFEVLDLIINSIQRRFDQPSFKVFLNLESLLIQAAAPTGNIDVPTLASLQEMHGDEIDMDALEVEANVFRATMSSCRVECFRDVYNKIKTCPESEKELILNIMRIMKLLLINPANSCSPERSFPTARRLKSWVRSTMTSQHFNWLALLNVHKDCIDQLDLIVDLRLGMNLLTKMNSDANVLGNLPKRNFRFYLTCFFFFFGVKAHISL